MALETASPYLALLDEPDYNLKAYALQSIDENVDRLWAEIADHLDQIEALYEDEEFPAPQLAALVASKVYYNLGEYDASMRFALVAGDKFDLSLKSEYIETIVSKCISRYIELAQKLHDSPEEATEIDPKLTAVAERMLRRCIESGDYRLATGVSLEARRLDLVEAILGEFAQQHVRDHGAIMSLVNYALDCSITVVSNREFRNKVLNKLVGVILALETPDYFAISKIIVQLKDAALAIRLFNDLMGASDASVELVAYQVAFDLVASAPQELLENVYGGLEETQGSNEGYSKLLKILSGVPTCDFNITFLKKHNNTDLSILNKTKDQLEGRNSIFHNAVTFENAFLHAGTTADGFFRSNLEWLSKATNWTKFTATAALGVIHQGNLSQGYRILQPYLPGNQGSCYTQGGSLYGLGIVFAGHGREVIDYLRKHVVEGENGAQGSEAEVVLHGAALGVGVAGMGSGSLAIYEELKAVLYNDSAIAGEATGLAMGLVMVGSKNVECEQEMLQYAHDTEHEKIIRSLALGIALINYAKEEAADGIIKQLIEEQDPILRYGGAFTIALAYAGTGNNKAIKMLLHIAVSDANDDVRRAAVMGLGFILLRNHTAVPRMVELLSESHNPHVRYGTALALGISCAGTGLPEAVEVLEPMCLDPVDFVRQGAMMALAMIMIQQNEKLSPKVTKIRESFAKSISAKHEDAMAKFGAAVAQGIIDAGGRNVTISLEHSQTGNLNMRAVVGLAVSLQFWYWFPLTHFLSLAFTPTAIVAVREDLKIPQFQFDCHAKPKWFDYPPKLTEKETKGPEKLTTAILSTTLRAKSRAKKSSEAKKKKEEAQRGGSMDIDMEERLAKDNEVKEPAAKPQVKEESDESDAGVVPTTDILSGDIDKFQEEQGILKKKAYQVDNMSRVLPMQLKYITFDPSARFVPVRKFQGNGGVIVVTDRSPKDKVEFIKTVRQLNAPDDDEDEEAPLPKPFKYDPPAIE
ncbi:26S proteasome regulatory subunit Rpn2p [Trichomonascus vanleenenianus]|uniref:proteasome regulatory particle base subunit RPN2 n=1 Tax=Trichomonascus vanleenenianus TaxID=2268995 RepID=UPI003EC972D6